MTREQVRVLKDVFAEVAPKRQYGIYARPVRLNILMGLLMLPQFISPGKTLPANVAIGHAFSCVLSLMVQQVIALAVDEATHVACVLNASRVNRKMFTKTVQVGEFALAEFATEEAVIVLQRDARIGNRRHFICKMEKKRRVRRILYISFF